MRLALAASACLLLAARATPAQLGSSALPPADLPEHVKLEPSEGSEPLRPSADAASGPPMPTPSLVEQPGRVTMNAWFDLPHAFVERRLFDISNGFDQFFADERDLDFLRSNTFLGWRSELRLAEDGTPSFGTTLRADIKLPYFQKRLRSLRLVLENAGRTLAGPDPVATSALQETGRGNALVRWTLLDTLRSSIDVGGGILLKFPPALVARTRYRFAHELGSVALFRLATSGHWNSLDGFGFKASMSLERPLVLHDLMLRWSTGTLVSQISRGYESSSEVALIATFGRTTAVTLVASGSAQSKPEPVLSVWRAAARFRLALFRRWLWGELEPEITWPLDVEGGRHAATAVMFRIEVQFEDEPPLAPPIP